MTQVDDVLYIPNVSRFEQTIQKKIEYFFNNSLKGALQAQQDSYIVDLFVAPNKVGLALISLRLIPNPIDLCTGNVSIPYQYRSLPLYLAAIPETTNEWAI